ncbi:MAG: response regulator [bacterium]
MTTHDIYVVEDEGITAKQIKGYLEKLGNRVPFVTDNSDEAIDEVKNSEPDLVLMDINLNGTVDGIEATERIVEQSDVPVVYLTAYGDEQTVSRARKSGAEGLILKPINRDDLERIITIVLDEETGGDLDIGGEMFTRWVQDVFCDFLDGNHLSEKACQPA